MARYPELPKFIQSEADAQELYNFIQQWGAALINELDTRDIENNAAPSTNIYAVATVGTITRPRRTTRRTITKRGITTTTAR